MTAAATPMPAEIADTLGRYFDAQRSILWGRLFDIVSTSGREAAIAWLAQVIFDVSEHLPDDVDVYDAPAS